MSEELLTCLIKENLYRDGGNAKIYHGLLYEQ